MRAADGRKWWPAKDEIHLALSGEKLPLLLRAPEELVNAKKKKKKKKPEQKEADDASADEKEDTESEKEPPPKPVVGPPQSVPVALAQASHYDGDS